jgi:hypothetical protein
MISLLLSLMGQFLLAQETQRNKDAAAVQRVLAALATTPVSKINSLKSFFLEAYKDDEDARAAIRETPEKDLEDVMGLKKLVSKAGEETGEMVDDLEAIKGVLDSYFKRYDKTINASVPYQPIPLRNFVPLLAKSSTLRELIKGTLYPEKVWLAEFQYGSTTLKVEDNPLAKLRASGKPGTFLKEGDPNYKELKEAFISITQNFLKENVTETLNFFADQVYPLRAGPMARWVRKEESRSLLTEDFREEAYSVFTVDEFVHADLLAVAKVKDLPPTPDLRKPWPKDSPWWKGIAVEWSKFQDGDYFVAAPCMIGMIGGESLGPGDVKCYVFRKVGNQWRVVGM